MTRRQRFAAAGGWRRTVAIGFCSSLLALAGGCAGDASPPPPPEAPMRNEGARTPRRAIEVVVSEIAPEWIAMPGVVGVAQTETPDGQPAILVLLAQENAAVRALIPSELEGYPVIIEVSGEIRALPDSGR